MRIEITIEPRAIGPRTAISADNKTNLSTSMEQMTQEETAALVSFLRYVAANENVSERALQSGVRAHFEVRTLPQIHRADFPKVISFVFELVAEAETAG